MNMKKPITIVSSISFLLFLIAIIWFGAGVYTDKKSGIEKADQRFSTLLENTQKNFQENQYGTYQFSNNFINAIGTIDDFSSLKLEVNGELVYSYPPELFTLPSPELVKSYAQTVYSGEKSFTLKASLYLVKPGSVYNHSRFAFILILFGTVIAGVFILILNGRESDSLTFKPKRHSYKSYSDYIKTEDSKKSDEAEEKATEAQEPNSQIEQTESSTAAEPCESAEPIFQETTEPEQTDLQSEEININFSDDEPTDSADFSQHNTVEPNDDLFSDAEDTELADDEGGLDIIDQMEQLNEQESAFDEDDFSESTIDFEDTPAITFETDEPLTSPVTSLRLQNSLGESFDSVIQSGKTQATVALIKINALDRGNEISQKIISILKDENEDAQIFEYKADSYAVLRPESDLQTTVDKYEQIYNKVTDFLKNNNATNEVSVGISSASGRDVKAERVILEANQALDYASQDPDSPIVAFRVKA